MSGGVDRDRLVQAATLAFQREGYSWGPGTCAAIAVDAILPLLPDPAALVQQGREEQAEKDRSHLDGLRKGWIQQGRVAAAIAIEASTEHLVLAWADGPDGPFVIDVKDAAFLARGSTASPVQQHQRGLLYRAECFLRSRRTPDPRYQNVNTNEGDLERWLRKRRENREAAALRAEWIRFNEDQPTKIPDL